MAAAAAAGSFSSSDVSSSMMMAAPYSMTCPFLVPCTCLPERSLHADAEPVLKLIQRGEAALLECLIPKAAQHVPGRLVIAAEAACRPLHRRRLVLPVHRHPLFNAIPGAPRGSAPTRHNAGTAMPRAGRAGRA